MGDKLNVAFPAGIHRNLVESDRVKMRRDEIIFCTKNCKTPELKFGISTSGSRFRVTFERGFDI